MGRKTTVWIFQATNKRNMAREKLDVAKKGNLKRETLSLAIAAQNNATRINYIKAKIDKTRQNSKFRLCGDRDGTINHMISKCSKLVQKEYKTRHDLVGKVIHWELSRKLKFGHTNKWYMHNPESILENEMHKLLWDFEIETDHLISSRQSDLLILNNNNNNNTEENLPNCGLCRLADHRGKLKESEKRVKYLDLAGELKALWSLKVTVIPIVISALGTVNKRLAKGLEELAEVEQRPSKLQHY